jgi:hypothetical protein
LDVWAFRFSRGGVILFSHSVIIVDMVLCNPPLKLVAVSLSNAGHCMESRFDGVLDSSLDWILIMSILDYCEVMNLVTYVTFSSTVPFDGVAGSDRVVLPLHLGDLGVGESQLDQSSSRSSRAGAAREIDLAVFLAGVFVVVLGSRGWSISGQRAPAASMREVFPVNESQVRGDVVLGEGFRFVLSLLRRFPLLSLLTGVEAVKSRLALFVVPWTASSPTVACLRSSRKVQSPALTSSAICFAPWVMPLW